MKEYGILGCPLGHTMSPVLHRLLAEESGIPLNYGIFEIPGENLAGNIARLKALDGFNVTIPHKSAIIPHLDALDESAKKYGAVNVVANENGKYIGYNTDCLGFTRAMEAANIPLSGRVCIVGAGGVGRMFATECACRYCQVTLAVKKEHILQMQQDMAAGRQTALGFLKEKLKWLSGHTVQVVPAGELTGEFDLLINATPVGMYPHTQASPVEQALLNQVKAVFDCIYNPQETLLMAQARKAGCQVVGGMPMLVWQAAAAQEIWNGVPFQKEAVGRVMEKMQQEETGYE